VVKCCHRWACHCVVGKLYSLTRNASRVVGEDEGGVLGCLEAGRDGMPVSTCHVCSRWYEEMRPCGQPGTTERYLLFSVGISTETSRIRQGQAGESYAIIFEGVKRR
jgi:hypothetical protein